MMPLSPIDKFKVSSELKASKTEYNMLETHTLTLWQISWQLLQEMGIISSWIVQKGNLHKNYTYETEQA